MQSVTALLFLRCLALLYIPAQSHGWPNIDPDYSYEIEPEGAKGIIHFCVLAAHLDRQREAAMEEYNQLNRFRKVS